MKLFIKILFLIIILLSFYYFLPSKALNNNTKIEKILVLKSERKLFLLNNNKIIKSYKISLGFNPKGAKHFEGDGKTPEGLYYIIDKNPKSNYFLNLGISYPSIKDINYAKFHKKKPGGDIKIHGFKNGFGFIGKFHRFFDWTEGCIALTNSEIQELYNNVEIGTPIEIKK
ncbi:MAG: L,D-transpeptidase family protein [Bacteroidales bacterium]|nr:L,D-transpeptidase family protein [Bacteroidales bacterium]